VPRVNTVVPDDQYPQPNFAATVPGYLQAAVDGLVSQLKRSVMLQVKSITSLKCVNPSSSRKLFLTLSRKRHGEASVAVLFSGGIDSAVLALLADE
jgi:asparagine synthetase B (glutamine-hydrolysing)